MAEMLVKGPKLKLQFKKYYSIRSSKNTEVDFLCNNSILEKNWDNEACNLRNVAPMKTPSSYYLDVIS
jgi:hypothetical protein